MSSQNTDRATVKGFGREWSTFPQSTISFSERQEIFDGYFSIFPWQSLPPSSVGADIGCGSGRWAALVAPNIKTLHVIDASDEALSVARTNLAGIGNVQFHHASVAEMPVADNSLDFAYSLGVLHHLPDTQQAIVDIASKLKPGAPFLLYLYYALENRSAAYRAVWIISNGLRMIISRMPFALQIVAATVIAITVYWPLARLAALVELIGVNTISWPLAFYRRRSFYVMRTDAFDRFCTRLEQRFTRRQIQGMLHSAGFIDIRFSEREPYWVAVALKPSANAV